MKNKTAISFIFTLVLLVSVTGCRKKQVANVPTDVVDIFNLKYISTKSICYHVKSGSELIPIVFHSGSDPAKVELLERLKPEIMFPSSDRIYLVGKLHRDVKSLPRNARYSEERLCREFELRHWFIRCPFREMKWTDSPGASHRYIKRDSLTREDLSLGLDTAVELSRYQRCEQ